MSLSIDTGQEFLLVAQVIQLTNKGWHSYLWPSGKKADMASLAGWETIAEKEEESVKLS